MLLARHSCESDLRQRCLRELLLPVRDGPSAPDYGSGRAHAATRTHAARDAKFLLAPLREEPPERRKPGLTIDASVPQQITGLPAGQENSPSPHHRAAPQAQPAPTPSTLVRPRSQPSATRRHESETNTCSRPLGIRARREARREVASLADFPAGAQSTTATRSRPLGIRARYEVRRGVASLADSPAGAKTTTRLAARHSERATKFAERPPA